MFLRYFVLLRSFFVRFIKSSMWVLKFCYLIVNAVFLIAPTSSSRFAKQIKSGTLTETKPIHLSLFETIKLAIASDQSNGVDLIEPEEKSGSEVKSIANELSAREDSGRVSVKNDSILRTCVNQISNAFWTLPRRYQFLSGVVFIGTAWTLQYGVGSNQRKLDDLNRKVDQLNNELIEVKTLLKTIVQLVNENGQRIRIDELWD